MTANLLLLLTAAIWGFGFVAQVLGMDYLGPFAFIGARFLLGALSLVPVIWYLQRRQRQSQQGSSRGYLLFASCVLGTILFVASSFQQVANRAKSDVRASFMPGYSVGMGRAGGVYSHRTRSTRGLAVRIVSNGRKRA